MRSKFPESFFENIETLLPNADAAIGAVTLAWSNAHYMVFNIFASASGMERHVAESVFFALRTDAAQRDITTAAVQSRLQDQDLIDHVCKTIDRLSKTSGQRNAFIHTIWAYSHNDNASIPMPDIKRHPKLQKNAEEQVRELLMKLRKLTAELARLHWKVRLHSASLEKSHEPHS